MKKSDQINILCGCNFGGVGYQGDEADVTISDGFCLDSRSYCMAVANKKK